MEGSMTQLVAEAIRRGDKWREIYDRLISERGNERRNLERKWACIINTAYEVYSEILDDNAQSNHTR